MKLSYILKFDFTKGWTQNLNYEGFGLTFDESKTPEYRIDSGNVATTIDLWVILEENLGYLFKKKSNLFVLY